MLRSESRKSKVFINGRFLTQRLTGVQRFALEALLALDALLDRSNCADELEFIVLAPLGAEPPQLQNIEFRQTGPLTGHAWEQLTLPRAAHDGFLMSFGPTGPLLKAKQMVTIHDASVHVVPQAFGRSFRLWYKTLLPILVRTTPFTMTVSEFSRDELVHHFGARRDKVGVSGEGWQHVLRTAPDARVLERHGLKPKHYVLAVSSVTPHKNFSVIARALPLLGDWPLQVVVAGGANPSVFGRTDLAALSPLKLVGYVDDAELRALYENAAAFIYPSLYEGFGIPPLEAMALGCPVIASNRAAIPETCGDAALYFRADDEVQLASLIRQLTSNHEQRQLLVEKGKARIEHHTWQGCAEKYLEALGRVVS